MENTPSNSNRTLWIVLAVLAVIACCCAALVAGVLVAGQIGSSFFAENWERMNLGNVEGSRSVEQNFAVTTPAQLVVDLDVGTVAIVAADQDSIEVSAQIRVYGGNSVEAARLLELIEFDAVQSGSTVTVTGGWPVATDWRGRSPQIDVRITTPRRTDVAVDLDAGEVALSGVEGAVDIAADVGRVNMADLQTPDRLVVETNVAEIIFSGALTPGASYRLTSDVGAIRMTLPADSAFAIDAASNVGAVTMGFDVAGETSQQLVGRSVQGVVGGDDSTTVYLRSDVGAISVQPE
jgi:hypothetical protein